MDRSHSFGAHGGPIFHEIRHTLYEASIHPQIVDYIYGLGGRDMPQKLIHEIYKDLQKILETKRVEKPIQFLVINTRDSPVKLRKQLNLNGRKLWTVPATDIAAKILGRPITNTAMLGAVIRASGIIDLKSLEKAVRKRFSVKLAEKNIAVIREAYKEAKSE